MRDVRFLGDDVLPEGLDQVQVCELMKLHKGMKDFQIEVISTGTKTKAEQIVSLVNI